MISHLYLRVTLRISPCLFILSTSSLSSFTLTPLSIIRPLRPVNRRPRQVADLSRLETGLHLCLLAEVLLSLPWLDQSCLIELIVTYSSSSSFATSHITLLMYLMYLVPFTIKHVTILSINTQRSQIPLSSAFPAFLIIKAQQMIFLHSRR